LGRDNFALRILLALGNLFDAKNVSRPSLKFLGKNVAPISKGIDPLFRKL
jgi:hypothetical protein